jgi:hypothetical protein
MATLEQGQSGMYGVNARAMIVAIDKIFFLECARRMQSQEIVHQRFIWIKKKQMVLMKIRIATRTFAVFPLSSCPHVLSNYQTYTNHGNCRTLVQHSCTPIALAQSERVV